MTNVCEASVIVLISQRVQTHLPSSLGKFPDSLLLGALADEKLAVLFGDYVAVEALDGYLGEGGVGVHYAVGAVQQADACAHKGVAVFVFGEALVEGLPVAKVAPAEVCRMGIDQAFG